MDSYFRFWQFKSCVERVASACRFFNISVVIRNDAALFSESQSRIILSCSKESVDKIRNIADKYAAPLRIIGRIGGKESKIIDEKKELVNLPLEKIYKQSTEALRRQIDRSY